MSRRVPAPGGTVLLGTDGAFPAAVFRELVAAGSEVAAVVIDGEDHGTPIFVASAFGHHQTVASLAASRGVPVLAAPDAVDPALWRRVTELQPDFILVACFRQRLPETLCRLARHDCLNLHPSLLPRYRGPTPLFWQLRAGDPDTGVTLHRVTPRIDAGEIVGQARESLADGSDGAAIDVQLAAAGARLFLDAVARYRGGNPGAVMQVEADAEYHRLPSDDDFRVSTAWSARRLFNFIRGTRHWGRPYPIVAGDRVFQIVDALAFRADGVLRGAFEIHGDRVRLACAPGILEAVTR